VGHAVAWPLVLEAIVIVRSLVPVHLGIVTVPAPLNVLVDQVGNEEVKVQVVVVIPPGRADGVAIPGCPLAVGPGNALYSLLLCHVDEAAVPLVLEEDVGMKPVVGDVDVQVPVVVEVPAVDPPASMVLLVPDPGLCRDVGEGPVPVVVPEIVGNGLV